MNDKNLVRDSLAELIGTFMLVFIGAGAGALNQPIVVVALAHGLILIAIIYTYGHMSGAHVNPAITLSFLIGGKISPVRAIAYWAAQFIGAIIAALALKAILPAGSGLGETTGSLTFTNQYAALLLEFIFTFFLVSVVTQAAGFGKAGNVAGLGIGLTLAACILFGGSLSGASLNPARTLGPALIANANMSYVVGYLTVQFLAGAAAALVHYLGFSPSTAVEEASSRPVRSNRKRG